MNLQYKTVKVSEQITFLMRFIDIFSYTQNKNNLKKNPSLNHISHGSFFFSPQNNEPMTVIFKPFTTLDHDTLCN